MTNSSSRATHEVLVGSNPPTTDQLFNLVSQVMSSARNTNTYRQVKTSPRAHVSISEVHYMNDAAGMVFDDYPAEIRHRMAIRIGRRMLSGIPMKEWSLRFFDTTWYERPEGDWAGVRSSYRFDWIRDAVTLAERKTAVVPQATLPELDDYLGHLSLDDDAATIFGVEQEMSQVTADDLDLILADVANYYGQVADLQRRPAA